MGIADNTPQRGYCIYAHINLTNNKTYIGISKNVRNRWKDKMYSYKRCRYFFNALKKYGWDGFSHVVMWDNLSFEEACIQEKIWISLFKMANMSYNITDGGEGTLGKPCSEEQKQKMRELMSNRIVTSETKEKLGRTRKMLHLSGKTIYAFDIVTKELIKSWPTIHDAAQEVGVAPSNISRAARGKRPSAHGYIWSYTSTIDRESDVYKHIGRHDSKKVYCYDLFGNYIRCYDGVSVAAEAINGHQENISQCCNGKYLSSGGYIWRYSLCEIEPEILNNIKNRRNETY